MKNCADEELIKFEIDLQFLTASACNAVLYISLLLSFDFEVCENSVQNEGKLIHVDKTKHVDKTC